MSPTPPPAVLGVLLLYYGCLSLLACLGVHRAWLLWEARRLKRTEVPPPAGDAPRVLVQLPVYNEPAVIGRLLAHAVSVRGATRVQVLDDSTDGVTTARIEEFLAGHDGVPVEHLRRAERTGFKAGALRAGLADGDEPFVAVFDADFLPPPDFLKRVLPAFEESNRIAFVQARWEHLNPGESLLTRAQATLLDGHFRREHAVRGARGLAFNFNGTAGVWRREAITDAGGWQHDTLTEDLDLSWRAYLRGWSFAYLPDAAVPAELPDTWEALRPQQDRWTRGSVQCLRKLGRRVWRAPRPLSARLEAMVPLLANLAWPVLLAMLVLSLPAFLLRQEHGLHALVWLDVAYLLPCTAVFAAFYWSVARERGEGRGAAAVSTAAAMLLAAGLVVNNSRAAWRGLRGGTGRFVRTPKRGDGPAVEEEPSGGATTRLAEGVLGFYLLELALLAAGMGVLRVAPFFLFFALGLLWAASGLPLRAAARATPRTRPPSPARAGQ